MVIVAPFTPLSIFYFIHEFPQHVQFLATRFKMALLRIADLDFQFFWFDAEVDVHQVFSTAAGRRDVQAGLDEGDAYFVYLRSIQFHESAHGRGILKRLQFHFRSYGKGQVRIGIDIYVYISQLSDHWRRSFL